METIHDSPITIHDSLRFDSWTPTENDYCPQTIAQLRARFPKATDHIHYVNEDIRLPPSQWPGCKRRHVFDFEDGLRLIVSRDSEALIHSVWNTTIQVSASIRKPSPAFSFYTPLVSRPAWQAVIIEHLEQISNFVGEVVDHYIGDPPKRILHLWFKEIR